MFPSTYYSLFPAFPRDNTCFVAMSFAPQFEHRWKVVVKPAIRSIRINNEPLEPLRVDQRTINDSILTEILTGIGRCRIVFADVTTLGDVDKRPVRNGNVMYEIGIAHAIRSPAEVVLFRSDTDPLDFDVANVRVNRYDPDKDPNEAFNQVQRALLGAFRELDLLKNLAVRQAAARLDLISWNALSFLAKGPASIEATLFDTMAVSRLLDNGLATIEFEAATLEKLRAVPDLNTKHFCRYKLTPLGATVLKLIASQGEYAHAQERFKSVKATLEVPNASDSNTVAGPARAESVQDSIETHNHSPHQT